MRRHSGGREAGIRLHRLEIKDPMVSREAEDEVRYHVINRTLNKLPIPALNTAGKTKAEGKTSNLQEWKRTEKNLNLNYKLKMSKKTNNKNPKPFPPRQTKRVKFIFMCKCADIVFNGIKVNQSIYKHGTEWCH